MPADQPTIQAGIDAASGGDTVLIAAGDYQESIDFKGKAITVTGAANYADVKILGSGQTATVSLVSGEGRQSILANLTIEGGSTSGSAEQAGIIIRGTSPTLRNVQVYGTTCHGIHVINGAPLIDHDRLVATDASISDTRCAVANGTGIFLEGLPDSATAVIQNSHFSGNATAIFASSNASVLIQSNVISENGSGVDGGKGAGILLDQAQAVILGNLIYDNFAQTVGGGVAILNSGSAQTPVQVINNTVADNRSLSVENVFDTPAAGADLDIEGSGAIVLDNNIFWANTAGAAVTCNGAGSASPAVTIFRSNDVYNDIGPTVAGVEAGNCTLQSGQNGNINLDPQFADAGFFQFHLRAGSPAIDAGSNAALQAISAVQGADTATDLDGNPRVLNGQSHPSLAIVDMGAYEFQTGSLPASFTLTSSLNPSTLGQVVTFSATVALQSGTAAGTITFADGPNLLGTVPLVAGAAQLSTASLTAGTHTITAQFAPNGSGSGGTASLSQVVSGYPTTTTGLAVTPATGLAFSTITLTSKVVSPNPGIPTGTVVFTAGGQILAIATLQSDGTAQATIRSLGGGTYSIVAGYSGDATYQASTSNPAALVLAPVASTITLASSPNPDIVGQSVTVRAAIPFAGPAATPSGIVVFKVGSVTLGTSPLDGTGTAALSTTLLPVGTNLVTAAYSGDANYLPGSASLQQVVTLVPTSTVLSSSPNPSYVGQAVTLVSATSAAGASIVGSVTFYDGTSPLATVPTAGGSASFTTSSLTVGQHALTAVFQAGALFGSSAASPVAQIVLAAGFNIKLAPPAITLQTGKSAATQVQLGSLGSFTGPLHLSFGPLPPHATGALAASSIQINAGTASSTTFSLHTVDVSSNAEVASHTSASRAAVLAMLGLPWLLWKRRRLPRALLSLFLGILLVGMVGCTEIRIPLATVAPGLYSIPINATDAHNVSQTALLQVTVTQ